MKNSKVKEVIFKAFIMALKLKYFIRANTFLGNKHRVTHSNSHQKLNTQQLPQTMCKRRSVPDLFLEFPLTEDSHLHTVLLILRTTLEIGPVISSTSHMRKLGQREARSPPHTGRTEAQGQS